MSSKQKKYPYIMALIFIFLAVGVYGYYLHTKNISLNTTSTTTSTSNSLAAQSIQTESNFGTVIYSRTQDLATNIYSKKNDSEEKIIFTDKDESSKIKYIGNSTSDAKILVIMTADTNQNVGTLYLINTDGSGSKQKISDSFSIDQSPVVSPDGTKIAYTSFSNVEKNYGFNIYVMDINSQNKVSIDNSQDAIGSISFNPNGKNISYIKEGALYTANIDGTATNQILKFDEKTVASSVYWQSSDDILIGLNNTDSSGAKIISANPATKDSKILDTTKNTIANIVSSYNDNTQFIYSCSQNQSLILFDGNTESQISTANKILKWNN